MAQGVLDEWWAHCVVCLNVLLFCIIRMQLPIQLLSLLLSVQLHATLTQHKSVISD